MIPEHAVKLATESGLYVLIDKMDLAGRKLRWSLWDSATGRELLTWYPKTGRWSGRGQQGRERSAKAILSLAVRMRNEAGFGVNVTDGPASVDARHLAG